MSKVGDSVWLRYCGQRVGGLVLRERNTVFGKRYFIRVECTPPYSHELTWRMWWRIW